MGSAFVGGDAAGDESAVVEGVVGVGGCLGVLAGVMIEVDWVTYLFSYHTRSSISMYLCN